MRLLLLSFIATLGAFAPLPSSAHIHPALVELQSKIPRVHRRLEAPPRGAWIAPRLRVILTHMDQEWAQELTDQPWIVKNLQYSQSSNTSIPIEFPNHFPFLDKGAVQTLPTHFTLRLSSSLDASAVLGVMMENKRAHLMKYKSPIKEFVLQEGIQEHFFTIDKRRYKLVVIYFPAQVLSDLVHVEPWIPEQDVGDM